MATTYRGTTDLSRLELRRNGYMVDEDFAGLTLKLVVACPKCRDTTVHIVGHEIPICEWCKNSNFMQPRRDGKQYPFDPLGSWEEFETLYEEYL